MLLNIKEKYIAPFLQMPNHVKLVVILTISVFLPVYITVPIVIAAFIYTVINKKRLKVLLNVKFINPLVVLGIAMLVVPLYYQNYYGFLCGILFIIFVVLEIYISQVMSRSLFDLACDICCGMSLVCIIASLIQKFLEHQARVEGLTYNSNFYAYIIELVVIICFYKMFVSKKPWIYILIAAANIITLSFTGCRSAWGAMVAGLFVLFLMLKKSKFLTIFSLVLAVMGVAICFYPQLMPRYYNLGPTMQNRMYIWRGAFSDFLNHPLFGRGLLAFYQVSGNIVTPHAHNILLDTLECDGIVGTLIILFFFAVIIKQLVAAYKSDIPWFKSGAVLCCSIIAATLVHGITDMPIMGINTGLLFFILLAFRPNTACSFEINPQQITVTNAYLLRFFKVLKKGYLTQKENIIK